MVRRMARPILPRYKDKPLDPDISATANLLKPLPKKKVRPVPSPSEGFGALRKQLYGRDLPHVAAKGLLKPLPSVMAPLKMAPIKTKTISRGTQGFYPEADVPIAGEVYIPGALEKGHAPFVLGGDAPAVSPLTKLGTLPPTSPAVQAAQKEIGPGADLLAQMDDDRMVDEEIQGSKMGMGGLGRFAIQSTKESPLMEGFRKAGTLKGMPVATMTPEASRYGTYVELMRRTYGEGSPQHESALTAEARKKGLGVEGEEEETDEERDAKVREEGIKFGKQIEARAKMAKDMDAIPLPAIERQMKAGMIPKELQPYVKDYVRARGERERKEAEKERVAGRTGKLALKAAKDRKKERVRKKKGRKELSATEEANALRRDLGIPEVDHISVAKRFIDLPLGKAREMVIEKASKDLKPFLEELKEVKGGSLTADAIIARAEKELILKSPGMLDAIVKRSIQKKMGDLPEGLDFRSAVIGVTAVVKRIAEWESEVALYRAQHPNFSTMHIAKTYAGRHPLEDWGMSFYGERDYEKVRKMTMEEYTLQYMHWLKGAKKARKEGK